MGGIVPPTSEGKEKGVQTEPSAVFTKFIEHTRLRLGKTAGEAKPLSRKRKPVSEEKTASG